MRGRIRSVATWERTPLSDGWEVATSPPGALDGPGALADAALAWTPAPVPGTVAGALADAGTWKLDGPPRRFDAEEVWYRTKVHAAPAEPGERVVLGFDGLATLADVWLDGAHVLSSASMFEPHELELGDRAGGELDLAIRFSSLDAALARKRPRPRWRAPMIEHQQLRWLRTTLLGRTPGWSPPAAAVGPWRPVWLERRREILVSDLHLATRIEGGAGLVEVSVRASKLDGSPVEWVELVVERGSFRGRAGLSSEAGTDRWSGRLVVHPADVERWWPHTHGEPALYQAALSVGDVAVELGHVGFRDLVVNESGGGFAVELDGAKVFCRGACFTPVDVVTLGGGKQAVVDAVKQARALGMNMLRVGGTLPYETDAFYDACDREGVLVLQDLAFANMDYPGDDADFAALATRETRAFLSRLAARPSLAVVCGNSEVEQQAAMWGAARELWSPPLFHETLAEVSREVCPGVAYWPSSAHGGAFPHQNDAGTTSYYGVGAYLRPLEDARRSEVRFATECLAFSNVPEPESIPRMPGGESIRVHHAAWKARAPRDLGAGWDFEDVRDHYLRELFRVEPATLRAHDHERYLALSRIVTGEVMAATFAEWRRGRSATAGALVWFLRDLWLGAGWGVIDATGTPKAAAHYLRRVLQPVFVGISDEGTNGLFAHVVNEPVTALAGTLVATLFRGATVVARGSRALEVAPRGTAEVPLAGLFENLFDTSYAYRFGPPSHDLVHVALEREGAPASEAFFFPTGRPNEARADLGLTAEATRDGDALELVVRSRELAFAVRVGGDAVVAEDSYFHVAPGGERRVRLRRVGTSSRCTVEAANASGSVRVTLPD